MSGGGTYRIEVGPVAMERVCASIMLAFESAGFSDLSRLVEWQRAGMPLVEVCVLHPRAWQVVDPRHRVVESGRLATLVEAVMDLHDRLLANDRYGPAIWRGFREQRR